MERRSLLKLGIGSALLLATAGGGLALLTPGIDSARLTVPGRTVFRAVGRAVLDGILPTDAEGVDRNAALAAQLDRLDATIASLPQAIRDELSKLLSLLAAPPGRVMLAGLTTPWADAGVAEIQAALQGMRTSTLSLRQQAYHALRDLTNAAYFSDPSAWPPLGYPGPRDL